MRVIIDIPEDVLKRTVFYREFKDLNDCITTIKALEKATPLDDAELVKRGKWEMKPDLFGFFDEIPVCSECGCTTKMREKTKYCPHCGARMDVE